MARIPDLELEQLKNAVSVERLVESSGVALGELGDQAVAEQGHGLGGRC